jgi:hypothetical protein
LLDPFDLSAESLYSAAAFAEERRGRRGGSIRVRGVRQSALIGARIIFNQGSSTLDCVIRDLSEDGARLSMSDAFAPPDVFDLFIPQKNATYRARVAWRRNEGLGVSFSRTDEAGLPFDTEAALRQRIRELETEVAHLRNRILLLTEG